MYLTRSGLSRPGVFLLATNLLVTILKSPFHASCSIASPFERVDFRRAARHSWRRAVNWSFHQYIEPLACLRLQRGIE